MRLFLGLELPEAVKTEALKLRCHWPGARWQSAEQLHLTLHFLGEVHERSIECLDSSFLNLSLSPINVRLQGVGVFGKPSQPRALWAGVEPEALLHRWYRALGDRLDRAGFVLAERPYQPHVTLARFDRHTAPADNFLREHRQFYSSSFSVVSIALFASHLSHDGARYKVVRRYLSKHV